MNLLVWGLSFFLISINHIIITYSTFYLSFCHIRVWIVHVFINSHILIVHITYTFKCMYMYKCTYTHTYIHIYMCIFFSFSETLTIQKWELLFVFSMFLNFSHALPFIFYILLSFGTVLICTFKFTIICTFKLYL